MITRALLFIKHRIPWLWGVVDRVNASLYKVLHRQRMSAEAQCAFAEFRLEGFDFRSLLPGDLDALKNLLERQGEERLRFFRPHDFDRSSLGKMCRNPSFLMFGVFRGQAIVGYFFLRCFWNRKCFVGRLIDKDYERLGIGRIMNQIMYNIAWRSGFRCMTTISRANALVVRSHRSNPHARVLGPLGDGYILVEFVPASSRAEHSPL